MKISSINIRGLGSITARKQFFNYIETQPADIWLLQETLVAGERHIQTISSLWRGRSFWSPAIGKQGGTAILVSQSFTGEILQWKKNSNGRILSIVKIGETRINIINIYTPTNITDRKRFFSDLNEYFFSEHQINYWGRFQLH